MLEAARDLGPHIVELQDEIDRQRRLPDSLVETLRSLGFYSLWLARAYGGPELSLTEFVEVIEALARSDASVAWCVTNGGGSALFSGFLPEAVARRIFVEERAVVAGNLGPIGKAVAVPGGYRVTGRWAYGSGVNNSTWALGGCVVLEGGVPRPAPEGGSEVKVLFFPSSAIKVIDTWNVGGLRGTGSHDYRVTNLFVPEDYAIAWSAPQLNTTLYRLPRHTVLGVTIAAVPLGIARAALDAFRELSAGKTSRLGSGLLRDKAVVQAAIGRAEAALRAARAFLVSACDDVWATASAGETITMEQRAAVRLACAQASEVAKFVVQTTHDLGGGTSVYESSPLQRCFRDAHAAAQHIQVHSGHFETVGRFILGLDPGPVF